MTTKPSGEHVEMVTIKQTFQHFSQEGYSMVKVANMFSQLLQHIPRSEFQNLVNEHGAEYKAKGFSC